MNYKELKQNIKQEAEAQLVYLREVLTDAEKDLDSKDVDEFNRSIVLLKCLTEFLNEDKGFKSWLNNMVLEINEKYAAIYDQYNTEH